MKKYYVYIIIGAILMLAPIYTLLSKSEFFLNKGLIGIEYLIEEGIDISEVDSIVSLNTGVDEKQIDVELADDGLLFIKLPFVEIDIEQSITTNLDRKYGDSIELKEYFSMQPLEFTGTFYLIIAILFISIVLGVALVVKGLIRFSNNTKTQ